MAVGTPLWPGLEVGWTCGQVRWEDRNRGRVRNASSFSLGCLGKVRGLELIVKLHQEWLFVSPPLVLRERSFTEVSFLMYFCLIFI